MRKALLNIIFLNLLLSTGMAHAFASPHDFLETDSVKEASADIVATAFSNSDSHFYKNDVLNDIDDYDEFDFDDHSTSLKEKITITPALSQKGNLVATDFKCKTFCDKIYTHVNFSRLPRYNYISLRVLRI